MTSARPDSRLGFTLVEVVIAAALAVFLVATMLTAIRLVYVAEEVGQDELLLFRTGNGLLDAMQRDLDAAVRMIDPAAASTTDPSDLLAAADGSDLGEQASTEAIDPAISMMRDRIAGAGDFLVSIRSPRRPAAELEIPATDALPISASTRHRRVWWHMGDGGLVRDAQMTDPGGEWVLLESTTDTTTTAMTVRFFDGAEWADSWDGVSLGVDPVAVEVTLTLTVPETTKQVVMMRVMPVAVGRYAVAEDATTDALGELQMLELGL